MKLFNRQPPQHKGVLISATETVTRSKKGVLDIAITVQLTVSYLNPNV